VTWDGIGSNGRPGNKKSVIYACYGVSSTFETRKFNEDLTTLLARLSSLHLCFIASTSDHFPYDDATISSTRDAGS
jgi:hypothetical protein